MSLTSPHRNSVRVSIAYFSDDNHRPVTRIYPESSGMDNLRPKRTFHQIDIHSYRDAEELPGIEHSGFSLLKHNSDTRNFYDPKEVHSHYYPEIASFLKQSLGAQEVIVFDSNTRSSVRSRLGQQGVREPVEGAHVDYTISSGPRRTREILANAGREMLMTNKIELINVWRPIVGPIEDIPLAVCDTRSTESNDFVESDIYHYGEEDLKVPRHTGQVYSVRYNPRHKWYFVPQMNVDEVLLLKGWSSTDQSNCFAPHTGFKLPSPPENYIPRESIEVRALVVY